MRRWRRLGEGWGGVGQGILLRLTPTPPAPLPPPGVGGSFPLRSAKGPPTAPVAVLFYSQCLILLHSEPLAHRLAARADVVKAVRE
ncbi:hypothetical protein DAERI_050148 [Deinococcus aerius]|uniref:Uncharacterized protein n=1 Tax=Deinococcus aerius TaxID=200253 RepID=A0A2I9CUT7_9DEIO|nr:hypothetical protein DAERI_050148 [Deinococcus aerius]